MPRQLLDIDEKKVEALASYGCTTTEIAAFFGCDVSTISKRFSKIIAKGKESGKIRLRQKQFEVAMKGNVSMLIWLGKQVLDQKDKQEFGIGAAADDDREFQVTIVHVNDKKGEEKKIEPAKEEEDK